MQNIFCETVCMSIIISTSIELNKLVCSSCQILFLYHSSIPGDENKNKNWNSAARKKAIINTQMKT